MEIKECIIRRNPKAEADNTLQDLSFIQNNS